MESQADSIFANSQTIETFDTELWEALSRESNRQEEHIELIASENYASKRVMEAQGGLLTNKYAEGYPHKRYYGGCEHVDIAEELAINRAKELFKADYANVQPHSGSSANAAAFLAMLEPNDTILGMSLDQGGHLTHGAKVNFSGKLYDPYFYGVDKVSGLIDYDSLEETARKERPKLIICGASAYSRDWDYARIRSVADEVGALILADISHPSAMIATKLLNDPLDYCHIVTSTTHKTLRGPRGGIIMMRENIKNPFGLKWKNGNLKSMGALLDAAVFPGTQGGPLEHVIGAKAVAFGEALRPDFRLYQQQVIKNAQALADTLITGGLDIATGGTDTHVMLVDLRPKGVKGNATETALGRANITCNKNGVPFDDEKPTITSGVRLGSPAGTTRGFGEVEFRQIGEWIIEVVDGLAEHGGDNNDVSEKRVKAAVKELCANYPLYPIFF